jgi:gliding motility-associated lipoprotein GldH
MVQAKTLIINQYRIFTFALMFIILFAVLSCGKPGVFDQSVSIPPNGWHKDTTALFVFDNHDTISQHSFAVNIRHTDAYAYRNLYLFLNTLLPNGRLTRDTIEILLADKEGQWLGQGFGKLRDYRFAVRNNLVFPLKGEYQFTIEQGMREEVLTGISDVGVRIE